MTLGDKMALGWVRAYADENIRVRTRNAYYSREKRAEFRQRFTTPLKAKADGASTTRQTLKWGDTVTLPDGISDSEWTLATTANRSGFVQTRHMVEVAYVAKGSGTSSKNFVAELTTEVFDRDTQRPADYVKPVLWGDVAQIIERGPQRCRVRIRGWEGKIDTNRLQSEPLLDVFFCDVGQGDGVYVRTPAGKHLLIDGGLSRELQQTGKNAADFVDWKFFFDYGDVRVRLDSLMASHSDMDHFGGLHDLVRMTAFADRELDCKGVDIDVFHHPGLSRWRKDDVTDAPHADGLGPKVDGAFIRLLGDRADAERATSGDANYELTQPWVYFVRDVLANSAATRVKRVGVRQEDIRSGTPLPLLWPVEAGCEVRVLGPVTEDVHHGGQTLPGLRDLGAKSKNTNGHSICLMLRYGAARILLTGDLNTKAMHWLEEAYDDRIGAFRCDVAKACHHGSDDISYRFLEAINAAATVISSGDAEGHAHPRPEVVAASACAGHIHIDRKRDKLITPLVYMTEIERSVTIGAINRMDIDGLPVGNDRVSGTIVGRPVDELNEMAMLSKSDRDRLKGKTKDERKKAVAKAARDNKPGLKAMENDTRFARIRIDMNLSVPLGPVDRKNDSRRAWRARMMHKTHYGLVTVRTDGETIMCATLDEHADDWIVHAFPARFAAT